MIQLDASDKLWSSKYIPELLIASSGTDLVVFQELMPFDKTGRTAIPIDQVHEDLSLCASSEVAFIAGGYVRQDKVLRNAVFFAYAGAIHGTYLFEHRLALGKALSLHTRWSPTRQSSTAQPPMRKNL